MIGSISSRIGHRPRSPPHHQVPLPDTAERTSLETNAARNTNTRASRPLPRERLPRGRETLAVSPSAEGSTPKRRVPGGCKARPRHHRRRRARKIRGKHRPRRSELSGPTTSWPPTLLETPSGPRGTQRLPSRVAAGTRTLAPPWLASACLAAAAAPPVADRGGFRGPGGTTISGTFDISGMRLQRTEKSHGRRRTEGHRGTQSSAAHAPCTQRERGTRP